MKHCCLLLFLIISCLPATLSAGSYSIVAVINGRIITNKALDDRMELIIKSSGLQDSKEIREKLVVQALQSMVNEELQRQEAEKLGLHVSDDDRKNAVADLERKNSVQPGKFDEFLANEGIPATELYEQIDSQILWRKIISRKVSPKIFVNEYEIQDELARLSGRKGRDEANLSVIFLPVDEQSKDAEIRILAEKLVSEIKGGANFANVAKQFSQESVSKNSWVIGWIDEGRLDKDIADIIAQTKTGEVTAPIKSSDGYRIFLVEGRRAIGSVYKDPGRIREELMMQKLDLEARKYLKNLRRNAFIEIKL